MGVILVKRNVIKKSNRNNKVILFHQLSGGIISEKYGEKANCFKNQVIFSFSPILYIHIYNFFIYVYIYFSEKENIS